MSYFVVIRELGPAWAHALPIREQEQWTEHAAQGLLRTRSCPRLVEADGLVAANSLNALNNSLARLGGSALGGALYATSGITGAVLADAASFAVAPLLSALVRASGAVEAAGDATAAAVRRWRRVWSEWREGLDVVRQGRAVGVVFAVTAITAVGDGIFGVMFVIWVKDALEGEALKLGWLQTCQAVGGLVGGVLGGYVGRRFAPERLFGLGLLVFDLFDLSLFNVQGGVYVVSGLLVLVALAPRRYRVAAPAKEAA